MSEIALTSNDAIAPRCPKCYGRDIGFEMRGTVYLDDGVRITQEGWTAYETDDAECLNPECGHGGQLREFMP